MAFRLGVFYVEDDDDDVDIEGCHRQALGQEKQPCIPFDRPNRSSDIQEGIP